MQYLFDNVRFIGQLSMILDHKQDLSLSVIRDKSSAVAEMGDRLATIDMG